ncbi:MAG: hypothetical protein ACRCYY_10095, partial [Trueperaceae bacterium]
MSYLQLSWPNFYLGARMLQLTSMVVMLVVLSGCGTPKTATDSPKEDYYLSVEEAQAMPSATDAETISAQGSP